MGKLVSFIDVLERRSEAIDLISKGKLGEARAIIQEILLSPQVIEEKWQGAREIICQSDLAVILALEGKKEEALEQIEQLVYRKAYSQEFNPYGRAIFLFNRGTVFWIVNHKEQALDWWWEASEYATTHQQLGIESPLEFILYEIKGNALDKIALWYYEEEKNLSHARNLFKDAQEAYLQAIKHTANSSKISEYQGKRANILVVMAKISEELGDLKAAKNYLQEAFSLCIQIGRIEDAKQIHEVLEEINQR